MSERGAVLQFEIDKRLSGRAPSEGLADQMHPVWCIARRALVETLETGGTFVCVVTADTLTIVQRPDAEDLS